MKLVPGNPADTSVQVAPLLAERYTLLLQDTYTTSGVDLITAILPFEFAEEGAVPTFVKDGEALNALSLRYILPLVATAYTTLASAGEIHNPLIKSLKPLIFFQVGGLVVKLSVRHTSWSVIKATFFCSGV